MKSETGEDYRTELLHQTRPEAESWRLNLREFRLPERSSADPPFSLKGLLHHMTPSMHDFAVNLWLFYVVSLMRWSWASAVKMMNFLWFFLGVSETLFGSDGDSFCLKENVNLQEFSLFFPFWFSFHGFHQNLMKLYFFMSSYILPSSSSSFSFFFFFFFCIFGFHEMCTYSKFAPVMF